MIKSQMAEIMAPVGSYESLAAAINAGADSIYFGVTQLNMRARSANNMTLEDLKNVAQICHEKNVKAYLTVNTLLYEHDMAIMRKIVEAAKENGIDAIIASDLAAIQYANQIKMPVHISTQLSISNYEAVKFFAPFTNRVVLARELTLEQIKSIHQKIVADKLLGNEGRLMEIECFVHGALCVAQSGRCFMSLHTYNSSANRGACKQNCRAKYKLTDIDTGKELVVDNQYIMSPTDLCSIDFIDRLIDAGISVFKIEGRGRPADYVDTVTRAYKMAAIDVAEGTYTKEKIEKYYEDLKSVFNRGLSSGYYLGQEVGSFSGTAGSRATKDKETLGKVTHFFGKAKIAEVTLESGEVKEGEEFQITGQKTGIYKGIIENLHANGQPAKVGRKGDQITFTVSEVVRDNDKFYRVFPREELQEFYSKKK